MVKINNEKCIGCAACVKDCFPRALSIENGKAVFNENSSCMACGHCIAVCLMNAVEIDDLDMGEVIELDQVNYTLDPDTYLNHLKSRRTLRKFEKSEITDEQIKMIIDSGRYSPTGGNRQTVNYHIYRNNVEEFKGKIIDQLKVLGDKIVAEGGNGSWYPYFWTKMYDEYKNEGKDSLYFDSDLVIVISSDSPQASIIAAAHMETMVYALGLGMIYSGFSTTAIESSKEIQDYVGIKENHKAHIVMAIGKPGVKYLRTVPRKEANIIWD